MRLKRISTWVSAIALMSAGCEPSQSILVLGDSILATHQESGQSVADVIAGELGAYVDDRSESGARVVGDPSILDRYVEDDWDFVVLNGGANDLVQDCGCEPTALCDTVLNRVVRADGTQGALPSFVDARVDAGQGVVVVGYYQFPSGALFGFDQCQNALTELRIRQQLLTERHHDAVMVNASAEFNVADERLYEADNVHPSPEGSRLLGRLVADAIERAAERGD